jgi:hypothetical protein
LANLKKNVKNNKILTNRPPEVKDWIEEASW